MEDHEDSRFPMLTDSLHSQTLMKRYCASLCAPTSWVSTRVGNERIGRYAPKQISFPQKGVLANHSTRPTRLEGDFFSCSRAHQVVKNNLNRRHSDYCLFH